VTHLIVVTVKAINSLMARQAKTLHLMSGGDKVVVAIPPACRLGFLAEELMRIFNLASQVVIICVILLSMTGCTDAKLSELRAWIEEVKQRPPQPLEPVPQIKQIDNFLYEDDDRRDPFVMDEQSAEAVQPRPTGTGPAPDPLRPKEELERYTLDSLRMVGTLEQDGEISGLIRSPDGILHRVRSGNYLGQNDGRITLITDNEIQLTELISEGNNEWRERQAAMVLKQ
jgi:type IV pilus assembly protein PilP